jgi:hypothetical protein
VGRVPLCEVTFTQSAVPGLRDLVERPWMGLVLPPLMGSWGRHTCSLSLSFPILGIVRD